MNTNRLEAFSDGVLAIIITIMVLEFKVPKGISFEVLKPLFPIFMTYMLSFIYLGIYWNNHHHLFHAINRVNGKILWANLNLLFWLSLLPWVTGWMGENYFEKNPTALYGVVLFLAALAFKILVYLVVKNEGKESKLAKIYFKDKKLKISLFLYFAGIAASFLLPLLAIAIYSLVGLMWIIPDKRIEKSISE